MMFGLFKQKEIDYELLSQNIVNAILTIWTDENKLPISKFQSFIAVATISKPKEDVIKSFMVERLRFISSVAITFLSKTGIKYDEIAQILDEVTETIKTVDVPDLRDSGRNLKQKSGEYAKIRFSANPRVAGKMIEDHFSMQAFGYSPNDNSVDQSYTLYKFLSAFERSAIFEISDAIRNSKV